MTEELVQVIPKVRSCDGCTMCCKTLGITEFNKPRNQWCEFCEIGKGCGIYNSKPDTCNKFQCYWLQMDILPEELRPDRCGIVMFWPDNKESLQVHVDPHREKVLTENKLVMSFLNAHASRGIDVLITIGEKRKGIFAHTRVPSGPLTIDEYNLLKQTKRHIGV